MTLSDEVRKLEEDVSRLTRERDESRAALAHLGVALAESKNEHGRVAQSEEHRDSTSTVAGSIPAAPTNTDADDLHNMRVRLDEARKREQRQTKRLRKLERSSAFMRREIRARRALAEPAAPFVVDREKVREAVGNRTEYGWSVDDLADAAISEIERQRGEHAAKSLPERVDKPKVRVPRRQDPDRCTYQHEEDKANAWNECLDAVLASLRSQGFEVVEDGA